jgi:CRP-like cAMP-binding protein
MNQNVPIVRGGFATNGFTRPDKCTASKLRSDDPFCCLSEDCRDALQKIKHTLSYPAGAILFTEGQVARGVYILYRGRVKLLTANSDGRTRPSELSSDEIVSAYRAIAQRQVAQGIAKTAS